MKVTTYLAAAVFILQAHGSQARPPAELLEHAAVKAAVLDYVNAIYQVQPDRIRTSVAPDLNKLGVMFSPDGSARMPRMTYKQLVELAATYNVAGRIRSDAKKDIRVLDVQSHIANAKLEAAWGTDYLLLTKGTNGRWLIRQVLWQAVR